MTPDPPRDLLLYDGVCGFCNRTIRFLLRRDPAGRFRFAPLQSALARDVLGRHGRDPDDLDTVYLVTDRGTDAERVFSRTRAILASLARVGWPWKALMVLWPLPGFLLDLGYRLVARVRYRIFGRFDTCPLPSPDERARFLGFDEVQGSPPPRTSDPVAP